jgi:hypothetical protein
MWIVVEVSSDLFRGMSVKTFGPYTDGAHAERVRRQILAANVDRYPHAPQRPHVFASALALQTGMRALS